VYGKYDAGYQIANALKNKPKQLLIDYQFNSASLELNSSNSYLRVSDSKVLYSQKQPYYLVVKADEWTGLMPKLPNAVFLGEFDWVAQEKFIPVLFNKNKLNKLLVKILLFNVPNKSERDKSLPSLPAVLSPLPHLKDLSPIRRKQ
jgi:hypothetical protein